jgi:hypothetical protein
MFNKRVMVSHSSEHATPPKVTMMLMITSVRFFKIKFIYHFQLLVAWIFSYCRVSKRLKCLLKLRALTATKRSITQHLRHKTYL